MKLNLINAGKVFNIRWCMSYDYEINMRGLKNYLTWKLFAFIFLNWDHVIHIFQNIYVRPFLMIYLSSNYYFRALLFWNRNPFLETNSSLVLGNFFRENKHDLKRFVVYLEVDNMGKHFFCANWIWIADWLKRWYILPWSFFFWHQFKNVSCDLNSIEWSIIFFYMWKKRISPQK